MFTLGQHSCKFYTCDNGALRCQRWPMKHKVHDRKYQSTPVSISHIVASTEPWQICKYFVAFCLKILNKNNKDESKKTSKNSIKQIATSVDSIMLSIVIRLVLSKSSDKDAELFVEIWLTLRVNCIDAFFLLIKGHPCQ